MKKAASYRSFEEHERELGLDEAIKIARLEHANVNATHALAKEYDIHCDSTPCQTVDIIYSQIHLDSGKRAIARMKQTMGANDPAAAYLVWNAQDARKKFLCPDALGAFQYEAGSLSAYAFAIGVLKLALKKGLNLQTSTPAEQLISHSHGSRTSWTVKTPRGSIVASNLIMATNGYTAHLLPKMQGLIVPLHGQVVAQRPGLGMPQTGLPNTYSFVHETGYEYMISRPAGSVGQGDIVIGGGDVAISRIRAALAPHVPSSAPR